MTPSISGPRYKSQRSPGKRSSPGFTYGNGLVHNLTQNVRGLPDTCGTTAYHADSLDYDDNANVAAITDAATGRNQRGNRTMTYDGLDRLTKVVSPMFANATDSEARYGYDVLDNLITVHVRDRHHFYCYDDANNRLTNIKTSYCDTGPTVVGLGYDAQGNLANKNGQEFRFDYGNRLRSDVARRATATTATADGCWPVQSKGRVSSGRSAATTASCATSGTTASRRCSTTSTLRAA